MVKRMLRDELRLKEEHGMRRRGLHPDVTNHAEEFDTAGESAQATAIEEQFVGSSVTRASRAWSVRASR